MAGRSKVPPSPATKQLRAALDEILRTASGLDRIKAGAGDRIRSEAAVALRVIASRAVSGG